MCEIEFSELNNYQHDIHIESLVNHYNNTPMCYNSILHICRSRVLSSMNLFDIILISAPRFGLLIRTVSPRRADDLYMVQK